MSTELIQQNSSTSIVEWLTLERLFYAAILVVAAFIRFFNLAGEPLGTAEAATSWIAWVAAAGLGDSITEAEILAESMPPTSPLFYSLQSLLFWIAGGSDWLARFLPALAGTVLVWFIWFMRLDIGRYVAIVLALLLAIDPWLVAHSRLADGTILSILCGLVILAALSHLRRTDLPPGDLASWRTAGLVGFGLLVVSGPQGWTLTLVLLVFLVRNGGALLLSRLGIDLGGLGADELESSELSPPKRSESVAEPEAVSSTTASNDDEPLSDSADVIESALPSSSTLPTKDDTTNEPLAEHPTSQSGWALGLMVGAALMGATGWLAFPEGLSYLATSITTWVEQITGGTATNEGNGLDPTYSLGWSFLRVVGENPLMLIFGLIGLITLWLNYDASSDSPLFEPLFLTSWTLLGLLLVLVPGRGPHSLVILAIPLLLAAAYLGGRLLEMPQRQQWPEIGWREIQVVCLISSVLMVLAFFVIAAQVANSQLSSTLMITLLLVVGLVLLLFVVLALLMGWPHARWTAGLYGGLLLLLVTLSNSWTLNHRTVPLAPDGFIASSTSSEIRLLVQDIRTLSAHQIGDPDEIPIRIEIDAYPEPLLAWYLRSMRNLSWSPSPATDNNDDHTLLLTFQGSMTSRSALEAYMGSDYELRQYWLPNQLPQFTENPEAAPSPFIDRLNQRWATELKPLARWIIYRKVDTMPPSETVVLWTRGM
ncbi:MAG: hypothetical protein AAF702_15425 [Chloroflexota bacterium]